MSTSTLLRSRAASPAVGDARARCAPSRARVASFAARNASSSSSTTTTTPAPARLASSTATARGASPTAASSRVLAPKLLSPRSTRRGVLVARTAASREPNGPNASAADAVNNGLACFQLKDYDGAVANFTAALKDFGAPSEDESRAALYNRACAYVKQKKYDDAKRDLTAAVNEYKLKFSVVLRDPDMEVFRGTPQYEEMANEEVAGFRSNRALSNLRAEAKEPFRFFKLYLFGGLGAGAFIGLIIILSRLAAALQGGDDAPELNETLKNLAVNAVAVTTFGFLLRGELAEREKTQEKVAREEEIGRLRVTVDERGDDVTLSALRGNYRVFIIAGSDEHVEETVAGLNKYKALLKEKDVVIATVDMLTGGKGKTKRAKKATPGAGVEALKAEFAAARGEGGGGSGSGGAEGEDAEEVEAPEMQFGKRSKRAEVAAAASRVTEKRWRVAPVDEDVWRRWIVSEVERSGFDVTVRDVFFSVGKNGELWKSGAGTPNWMKIIEDLPSGVGAEVTGI